MFLPVFLTLIKNNGLPFRPHLGLPNGYKQSHHIDPLTKNIQNDILQNKQKVHPKINWRVHVCRPQDKKGTIQNLTFKS
jgi:hypothetical protein